MIIDTPMVRGNTSPERLERVIAGMQQVYQTTQPVMIYPASGSGAWEAALVNTLSPGDKVLMVETGQFATLWKKMADKLGIKSEFMGGDWRKPADPAKPTGSATETPAANSTDPK